MCIHHWRIGRTKGGKALQLCIKCHATVEVDAIWPPGKYRFASPNRHTPKMSQLDKDVGAMFAGLPSNEWYL